MAGLHGVQILLCTLIPFILLAVAILSYYFCCRSNLSHRRRRQELESCNNREPSPSSCAADGVQPPEREELIRFASGEGLTIGDILEAPGEVVGRTNYGTVYRATLRNGGAVVLRFVRPACAAEPTALVTAARLLGAIRHPNLVPLRALYVGPRGEKLFVHPFYAAGTVARLLREGVAESLRWDIICKFAVGAARGLDHLHTGLQKPVVHGNLKTTTILLDADLQPRVSDFGLNLILNPTACQEMLQVSAAQGYKAPELVNMEEATPESDIYSLGVILLEMLTQEAAKRKPLSGMPTSSFKELVLEQKMADAFGSELVSQSKGSSNGDSLLKFFQLAMACYSPSPTMRPGIKDVLTKLEEIHGMNTSSRRRQDRHDSSSSGHLQLLQAPSLHKAMADASAQVLYSSRDESRDSY